MQRCAFRTARRRPIMSGPMSDQSFISGSLHDMHFHVPEQPAPPPVPAGRSRASHLRLWLPAIGGLALDLWSKDWAVTHLSTDHPRMVIENVLNLRLSLNPGALFGLGAGLAPIFVGASVLALLFVLYLFWQSTASQSVCEKRRIKRAWTCRL